MKPLLITAILAAATTPTLAGGWSIGVGVDSDGDVRLGVGYRSHRPPIVQHHSHRRWEPGHYDTVTRKVFVPATRERVYQAAVYEWRTDPFGIRYRVCVREAGYRTVYVPARWEHRSERVWHPGRWVIERRVRGHRAHEVRTHRGHRAPKAQRTHRAHRTEQAVRVRHSTPDRRALHRGDRDGRRIRTS